MSERHTIATESADVASDVSGAQLDAQANRKARKYAGGEIAARIMWGLVYPIFRCSPRILFGWRRFILRCLGAKIGKNVHIYNSARIFYPWKLEMGDYATIGEHAEIYNLGMVTIQSRATVSQRAHLCAGSHDYNDPALPLLRLPITIGEDSWICADAFVGPNVTVGKGAIVGARAVVMSDVEPWNIVSGNPAKFIKLRELQNEPNRKETGE
ncbi:Chloramphenicol acetyltransferase [Rubripirellula amarantea]|uniref:Chloramphenicol acetyltransferase n=1 Tax=Rubripirellula amarantea TaxID=2527999 RepID=A0A5C5WRH9_9BACT|nr:hypothetical protein [Rubripirellula amarantea]TWT52643.1 Chloramphenicol acetyltransferase [Rubripirellula amarantea]